MAIKKCMACLKPIETGVLCEEHDKTYRDAMRLAGTRGVDTEKLAAEAQARHTKFLEQEQLKAQTSQRSRTQR
jgi:hypothetical protein